MWSASKQEMLEMERQAQLSEERLAVLRSAAISYRVAYIIADDLRSSTITAVKVVGDILEVEFTSYGVADIEHYDINNGERMPVFRLAKAA